MPIEETSTNKSSANAKPLSDRALLAIWRRLLDYDSVSSHLKKSHINLREYVIVLGLLTSAGAVISIYLQQVQNGQTWLRNPDIIYAIEILRQFLRVSLIIMPILSVTLLRYAAQFAPSNSWIEYRVGAETLRSQIYRYRLRAGDYKKVTDTEAKKKLLDAIDAANDRIDEQGATVPYMQNYEELEKLIYSKTDNPQSPDDGLSGLSIEQYIEWRVRPQLQWYIRTIQKDYDSLRREQSLILLVGAFGAVLSGLGQNLEAMVAVTTAMGIALTSRSGTRMYGATYGIFHWTAGKLQHELNKWEVMTAKGLADDDDAYDFVDKIEKIFEQERELWRAQAMQSQENSDSTIQSQLTQRIDRQDFEAHRRAGIVPTGIPDDDIADEVVNYTKTTTQSFRLTPEQKSALGTAIEQKKEAENQILEVASMTIEADDLSLTDASDDTTKVANMIVEADEVNVTEVDDTDEGVEDEASDSKTDSANGNGNGIISLEESEAPVETDNTAAG